MSASPLRQLALQGAAVILVLSLAWPYYGMKAEPIPWAHASLAIGIMALALATVTRQPWWWRVMHAVFVPLAWIVSRQSIDPGWFLLGFIILVLVYRGALSGQVPLYLSNKQTVAALADLIADRDAPHFADLGAGIGSTVIPLAVIRPDGRFTGVEYAPLTWLGGRLLGIGRHNLDWRWGDLWQTGLDDFDVVYAFLSPVPMAELWEKVEREMKPGSLFISNTFPVPGVVPTRVVEVDCTPARPLYCYER